MVLRLAAIGCGDIAQRKHFPDLAALREKAELVAIAGRDRDRLAACAARFNVPHIFTDPASMLTEITVDGVMVLTPPDSHAQYAEMAVRAGKHVMVEKPLVTTAADGERLRETVRSSVAVTFFPLPNVATAEHRLVDRLLRAGAVGQVTSVESHKGHRGPTHAGWFYRKALSGGGVLSDLGIYGLSTIATVFGPAVSMTAQCTRCFETRTMDDGTVVHPDVEDSALIALRLQDGTAVNLNANWNGFLSHHHTRSRTVVIGREGILHFGVADGGVYLHRLDGNYAAFSADAEPTTFDGQPCQKYSAETASRPASIVAEFISRIEAADTSTRSLDIQTHVLEIIARAYDAPVAAQPVPIVSRF